MRDYTKLDAFLDARVDDIYPEPFGEPHISIITQTVPALIAHYEIKEGAKVLDVGCGHGLALRTFREHGCDVTGIGFGEEAQQSRDEGFEIVERDMSFLEFEDATFDVVWCRHVLEHSVFPYFTLQEMARILKPGGVFYAEVPAPDTPCKHELNPNHYSVLTRNMWLTLMGRVGFHDARSKDITFNVPAGKDTYYMFDCRKAS